MKAQLAEAAHSFAFGPFLLIPGRQQLLENEAAVRVGGRALDLLTALVERRGQVVYKQELIALVWPRLVVEEGNLKVNISAIRRLLGDDAHPPRYIETVVGVGYRFIADVRAGAHRALPFASPSSISSSSSSRTGDPQPPSPPLFGRDEAIEAVLRDLQRSRLVSIVGPGGIGKTALAVAVARRGADSFRRGTWWVDLAKLDEPARVPAAIADAHDHASSRHGDMLLVLDNCEHLVGAVATCVDQLLMSTRHVKLIATSREPLCIRGEQVRRLSGLELPPTVENAGTGSASAGNAKTESTKAEDVQDFPAVQLFVERASATSSAFRLDDANASDVVAICRMLDGHALAIERVARRVGALGIAGTLDHLDRRFHMVDGYHEGHERHRTLTATVDASYALLSPSERTVLRRLSTFDGPFNLASACIVGGAQDIDAASVVEDIAQLVAKSLLLAEPHEGEMRYRQTHLTRSFAMEQLIALGEQPKGLDERA